MSSSLLSRMARDRGVACRETLTGFKWIVDAAIRGEKEGLAFVFGYEEALGYTWARSCATRTASAPRCASRSSPAS